MLERDGSSREGSEPDSPFDRVALGRAVRGARLAAGLSPEVLAARSGVPLEDLIGMENATQDCAVRDVHAVAHALAVPFKNLIKSCCVDQ
ncbi:helix-turn-helix transcriptional regulator [Actinoplanes sp. NPDC024001]|uniref:helix-turn-helix domain-containing protein n=1 Tax=Actinoplanes sp. NPDC024001 TaxID=3154598 RepID=UPI0033F14429